jgi:hypothetical protein
MWARCWIATIVAGLGLAVPVAAQEPLPSIVRLDPADALAASSTSPDRSGLSAERAQVLLRSLTIPGWGQATLGDRTSAIVFFVADLAIWTSFVAFRVQEEMRTGTYEQTAQIFAGIDLSNRDEEYRRIVGSYISSEEYNRLVVYRDAANLYYDDPERYRQYIAENSVGGSDAWAWNGEEDLLRYQEQRKDAQRADTRAHTALAAAVINRLLSAVHVARLQGRPAKSVSAWDVRLVPLPDQGPDALGIRVRTRF